MAQGPSPADSAELNGYSVSSSDICEALNDFKGVRSTTLHWLLEVPPLLFLIGVLVVLGTSDLMFTTGVFTAVLALFTFLMLMKRIPDVLATLWLQKIIAEIMPLNQGSDNQKKDASAPLTEQYIAFIMSFESMLNSHAQWLICIVFAFLGFVIVLSQSHHLYLLWPGMDVKGSVYFISRMWSASDLYGHAAIVAQPLLGLLLGFVAWRMAITGVKVWQLGKKFGLNPRIGHPDMCGGLESMGNLCLLNAVILAIPAIYLGAWVMLVNYQPYKNQYANYYVGLQSGLLAVPILLSTISFFLPVWSAHQIMLAKRREERLKLGALGIRMKTLEEKLKNLSASSAEEIDNCQKISREIESLHQSYNQIWNAPTWPFNAGILRKFALAQVVPLLGLTNLGKPILDVIGSLLSSLGPK